MLNVKKYFYQLSPYHRWLPLQLAVKLQPGMRWLWGKNQSILIEQDILFHKCNISGFFCSLNAEYIHSDTLWLGQRDILTKHAHQGDS